MGRARWQDAEALLREIAMVERASNDRLGLANTLENLGVLLRVRGDYSAARWLLAESLTTVREVGERYREAVTLRSLGMVECAQGNRKAAKRHLREALTICQESAIELMLRTPSKFGACRGGHGCTAASGANLGCRRTVARGARLSHAAVRAGCLYARDGTRSRRVRRRRIQRSVARGSWDDARRRCEICPKAA
jgi:tetratricopeptide (TPR) repeat protein